MAEESTSVTTDEMIVVWMMLGADPRLDPAEVVDTLRTIRANAEVIAEVQGVTIDDPIGPARAHQIVLETGLVIGAGRAVTL